MTMAVLARSAVCRTGNVRRPFPSLFFVPGLASRPVWSPEQLTSNLQPLIDNLPGIRDEYKTATAKLPSDYMIKDGEHTLHQGNWEWRSMVSKGKLQASFQALCPTTAGLLQSLPDLLLGVPFAYSFFSTLKPGTVIAPHYGPSNLRVRVHLPLEVPSTDPDTLGIEIAGQRQAWRVGQPLVFDDTYQHSVWSKAQADRVVLLFDLWHPELEQSERVGIMSMFEDARRQGWLS